MCLLKKKECMCQTLPVLLSILTQKKALSHSILFLASLPQPEKDSRALATVLRFWESMLYAWRALISLSTQQTFWKIQPSCGPGTSLRGRWTPGTLPTYLALAPSVLEAPLHLWAQLSMVAVSKPLRFFGFLLYKMRKLQKVRFIVS